MKKIMGLDVNTKTCIEQLANKTTNGDCTELANKMNEFFLSVSEHLPRLKLSAQPYGQPNAKYVHFCTCTRYLMCT